MASGNSDRNDDATMEGGDDDGEVRVCDRAATDRPGLGSIIHMRDVTARSLSTHAAAASPIDGLSRSEAAAASRVSPALAAGAVVAPLAACRARRRRHLPSLL